MRPTRLEVSGFASFRDHTVVDFTDADLFVLSGPTGAGKSSLIDAMTMALFGSVARYGDARLVEPVISQGQRDARVLLEFTADGTRYRVARRIQRTASGGATTKEARLEQLPAAEGADPIDLAMGAKEVTANVEAVLGLTFDHFCRTVVLPQGSFQEFLHAKPGERQELLVRLLDLGIYRDVATRARARATEAEAAVNAMKPQLERLAGVTESAITQAKERVAALDQVAAVVAEAQPELDAIKERGTEARLHLDRAKADLERLGTITAPDDLDDLAKRLAEVDDRHASAVTAAEAAATAREQAEDAANGLPTAKDLTGMVELRARLPELADARDAAGKAHEDAQTAATSARKEADEAVARVADAERSLRALETAHGAHAMRAHLVEGEPCPVCEQDVTTLPTATDLGDLDDAREALVGTRNAAAAAEKTARAAETAEVKAAERATTAATRLEEATAAVATRASDLGIAPDLPDTDLTGMVDAAREREAQLADLRTKEREARQAVTAAAAARTKLDGMRATATDALRTAHASVADLGAPAPTDDLAASWQALLDWTGQERPRREQAVADAQAERDRIGQEWTARSQQVIDACTKAGIAVQDRTQPAVAVTAATSEAKAQLSRLVEQQQEAARLQAEVYRRKAEREVAHTLGQLLNAKNFEQWLLARGLSRLVVGASSILGDLSRGAYALTLDDDNTFLVVDHRNAGEVRHARSLSGGETFLASLALALSLAEHVTDLAAKGSAKLESLFLDEGFGTLDADTLDVVAASIEELGATGRMVGVITHVRELAERVPTRFEVRKGPGGSTVERVDT